MLIIHTSTQHKLTRRHRSCIPTIPTHNTHYKIKLKVKMNNFNLKIKIKTICRWQIYIEALNYLSSNILKIKNLKISEK